MSALQPSVIRNASTVSRSMHDYWGWFLAEGMTLSILGLAAILIPAVAGVSATVVFGWLFLIAGIVGMVATLNVFEAPGSGWSLLSAFAAVIAGGLLLWNPFQGLVTLAYVLTAFFIVDGIFVIILAIAHRRELSGKMGMDDGQRHHRSDSCRNYHLRLSRHARMGFWSSRWHRYDLRWSVAHCNGAGSTQGGPT